MSKGINPDEAVAYGATVLAGHLGGAEQGEKLIVDVIPHSLGIQTVYDGHEIILKLNTAIPAEGFKKFTTYYDHQKAVHFPIYEGEQLVASQNRLIGEFTLEGIQIEKAGVPSFLVTMAVDENGILKVTAKDRVTQAQKEVTVKYNEYRIAYEEMKQMKENEVRWIQSDMEYQNKHIHDDL